MRSSKDLIRNNLNKMISDETISLITETLANLADRIHKETGEKIIIAYGLTNDEEIWEGAVSAGSPDYSTAAKMMLGMNNFVGDHYGAQPCKCDCLHCEFCED